VARQHPIPALLAGGTGRPRAAAWPPANLAPVANRQRQMSPKPEKRQKSGANRHFFAETGIPFALPSLPQPAYPDASGMPVSAGTDGSITFFDSAETT
jgi:hypothetical protein